MAGKEGQKKRFWSDEEKVSICLQPCTPGVFVAQVARRYAMNANLIHEWLRDPRFGGLYGCARDERSRDTGCYPRKGQEDHAQQEIALYRAQGLGVCVIARKIRRSASSISRERHRNAATRSGGFACRATTAQWFADRAARRPKATKLAQNNALRPYVEDRLSGQIPDPKS